TRAVVARAARSHRRRARRIRAQALARVDPFVDVMATKTTTTQADAPALMDTREVAAYLRLKERRIYDLVRERAIPHVRGSGKLLFPRAKIDAWLAGKSGAMPLPAARR